MAGELNIRHGYNSSGSVHITGSTNITGSLTLNGNNITIGNYFYSGSSQITGSLGVTGSISISQTSASVSRSPKVLAHYQPVTWYYNSDNTNLWADDYIKLSWDASADLEITVLQTGSGGKYVQVAYERGSTNTISTVEANGTKFDLDSNFSTSTMGNARVFCIGDNNYPVYHITVVRASTENPGIWGQISRMTYD
jgi:hypothetical protein